MTQDTKATRVIFRVFKPTRTERNGDVIALFPDLPGNVITKTITCYQHLGQHGDADYDVVIERTRPALPAEYAPLQRELNSIGYKLRIIARKGRR